LNECPMKVSPLSGIRSVRNVRSATKIPRIEIGFVIISLPAKNYD
jgi:hypothetical protein